MALAMIVTFTLLRLVLFSLCYKDAGAAAVAAFFIGLLQDIQVVALLFLLAYFFRYIGKGIAAVWRLTFGRVIKKFIKTSPQAAGVPSTKRPIFFKFEFASFVWCFIFIFICLCEYFFWREFETRFNFIAVDYLVYTHEVWANIWQSYPVPWLLVGCALLAFCMVQWGLPLFRSWQRRVVANWPRRMATAAIVAVTFLPILSPHVSMSEEHYQRSLAKNGWKSFVQAYFNNQIIYKKFYKTLPDDNVRALISKPELAGHMNKWVTSEFPRKQKLNVVLVVMESMSARYLASYGDPKHLTPTLDRLYKKGVAFSNFYASGTRTVRGLEAVFLSVPPTPGESIIRRPGYENLYNMADYLKQLGYHSQFLYGGYSIFDNMGPFFKANGMEIVDRSSLQDNQVTFENAWGVCDEDMYKVVIEQADKLYAEHKPFFQLMMTISNHRPYTYPNHIDIPSGSGRDGAVKYADYAIREFLDEAKTKPWFKNTIFAFVADHNAAVAGRTVIPVHDFPIPFVIYAPGIIKPQVIPTLGSQIDVGPTLLDLLGVSYQNHFFGKSLMRPTDPRAFLSTYQDLGYLKNNILTILEPRRKVHQYDYNFTTDAQTRRKSLDENLVDEAIAYYQYASDLFESKQMKNTGDDKAEMAK